MTEQNETTNEELKPGPTLPTKEEYSKGKLIRTIIIATIIMLSILAILSTYLK